MWGWKGWGGLISDPMKGPRKSRANHVLIGSRDDNHRCYNFLITFLLFFILSSVFLPWPALNYFG